MEPLAILGVLIAGYFAGNLVFVAVLRWIYTLVEILNDRPADRNRRTTATKLALATLLSSGLWMLLLVAFFAYHVRSELWAPWFFAGFGGGLLVLGFVSVYAVKRKPT